MAVAMIATCLLQAVVVGMLGRGQSLAQGQTSPPLRSATEFLSPELAAEQRDELRNRGMLWVEQGAALWNQPVGTTGQACAACHGAPERSMPGVAARLPAIDAASGQLINLEGRINHCRTQRQNGPALAYDSNELLALTALIARQSLGLPLQVAGDSPARPFVEAGRRFWYDRQGQLNLSCSQCHDDNVGRKLRGDTISSAVSTGYPVYRLEWQGMGSLHRRLKACQLGVRAVPFEPGAPEYLALELYLAVRGKGLAIEAPALRR
jgi:L-cysteine S-thiosulfotransferase